MIEKGETVQLARFFQSKSYRCNNSLTLDETRLEGGQLHGDCHTLRSSREDIVERGSAFDRTAHHEVDGCREGCTGLVGMDELDLKVRKGNGERFGENVRERDQFGSQCSLTFLLALLGLQLSL